VRSLNLLRQPCHQDFDDLFVARAASSMLLVGRGLNPLVPCVFPSCSDGLPCTKVEGDRQIIKVTTTNRHTSVCITNL
jgi:hypothetical protein